MQDVILTSDTSRPNSTAPRRALSPIFRLWQRQPRTTTGVRRQGAVLLLEMGNLGTCGVVINCTRTRRDVPTSNGPAQKSMSIVRFGTMHSLFGSSVGESRVSLTIRLQPFLLVFGSLPGTDQTPECTLPWGRLSYMDLASPSVAQRIGKTSLLELFCFKANETC